MNASPFLIMMLVFCACKKSTLRPAGLEDPRTRKQVSGTVLINTCNCTNPWYGKYPTIIQLDIPIGQQLFVYSADLADSFRVIGGKIKFDIYFNADGKSNWCNGIPLPEEARLTNVEFE